MCINGTYLFNFLLGLDYVTLGSIRQYDNFSQDICEHDSRGIWKRTTTLVPSLKKSQIVCEAVGIRPNRTKVRVEVEVIKLKGDQLQRVLSKDYTKKLRDDDICSEVGCILYRMKT